MNGSISRVPVTSGRAFITACAMHTTEPTCPIQGIRRTLLMLKLVPLRSFRRYGNLVNASVARCPAVSLITSPLRMPQLQADRSTYAFYAALFLRSASLRLQNAPEVALSSFATPEKLLRHSAAACTDPALESRPLTGFNTLRNGVIAMIRNGDQ